MFHIRRLGKVPTHCYLPQDTFTLYKESRGKLVIKGVKIESLPNLAPNSYFAVRIKKIKGF